MLNRRRTNKAGKQYATAHKYPLKTQNPALTEKESKRPTQPTDNNTHEKPTHHYLPAFVAAAGGRAGKNRQTQLPARKIVSGAAA